MRVIAGRWRGRPLKAPKDARVRPTGDRAREAWMSIVQPALPGARVLDLCAGSGALGIEALSRGAATADFVDLSPVSLSAVRENGETLGALAQMRVHRGDALRFARRLEAGAYDVAFADPPYGMETARQLASLWLDTPFAAIFGVEHDATDVMPPGGTTRVYGGTAITIYRTDEPGARVGAARA